MIGAGHNAERRTERVHVRVAMAHDEHLAAVFKKLRERFREQTRFHARLPRVLLPPSAVETVVKPVLHDGLIAAAAERKLHGLPRVAFGLQNPRRDAERQRNGNRRAGTRVDAVRLLDQRELLLLEPFGLLGFHNHQETSVLKPPIYAAEPAAKLRYKPLNLCKHRRASDL